MAVEFDVKLMSALSATGLRESADAFLRQWFREGEVTLSGPAELALVPGTACRFAYGEEAQVAAMVYHVPAPESAWWVTFSATVLRTPESVLLAVLLAAMAALSSTRTIVDDAHLLRRGTEPDSEEILGLIERAARVGDVRGAAATLFGDLFSR